MNSAELLLIFVVAFVVFGPNKLPMLARHLGLLMRKIQQLKLQAQLVWEQQLKQIQLEENERKALEADKQYQPLIKLQNDQLDDGNRAP